MVTLRHEYKDEVEKIQVSSNMVSEHHRARPVSAVGSVSQLVFRSSKVRLPGLTHSFTSCQLLVKE